MFLEVIVSIITNQATGAQKAWKGRNVTLS